MKSPITPVILSGGAGSRLWPLSRKLFPKQFLPIVGQNTMFQATISRLEGLDAVEAPLVICNEEHRFMAAAQLQKINSPNQGIFLEPVGRNTGPAITLSALHIAESNPEALLLILPADHVVEDPHEFQCTVDSAREAAIAGRLVTFGVTPTSPETGYGYIQCGSLDASLLSGDGEIYSIASFFEKPNEAKAKEYIQNEKFLWNSGIFLFRADILIQEMDQFRPEIVRNCKGAMKRLHRDGDFIRIDHELFSDCPNLSIDYAIMETSKRSVVAPLKSGWNDVGAWSAVWEVGEKDEAGNVLKGDILVVDSENNLVHSDDKLISLIGVENLVVVNTKDAVLISHRDKVQDVKKVVDQMNQDCRPEPIVHREVYRPWGSYDSIDSGSRFQVKRITVNPGETLSLQKHYNRAEHWIVVSGTAEVTRDTETFLLTENESTYIPLGVVHRLSNPGKLNLELIEVQSGSYLGEDDIVRYEDAYGRIEESLVTDRELQDE